MMQLKIVPYLSYDGIIIELFDTVKNSVIGKLQLNAYTDGLVIRNPTDTKDFTAWIDDHRQYSGQKISIRLDCAQKISLDWLKSGEGSKPFVPLTSDCEEPKGVPKP